MQANKQPATVEEYIGFFPPETQTRLRKIRKTIQLAIPEAQEVLSYHMPAYKLNGIVLYFAGYKNHIGIYPYPSAMEKFKPKLKEYKTSKSTIQFSHQNSIDYDLIKEIAIFRAKENQSKKIAKK